MKPQSEYDYQKNFLQAIRGDSQVFLPTISKTAGRLTTEAALAVYQNGYIGRLTDALGEIYQTVWRILGDDKFFMICREFIIEYPSTSYSLNDYHPHFSSFLKRYYSDNDDSDNSLANLLYDLAQLEWQSHLAYHWLVFDNSQNSQRVHEEDLVLHFNQVVSFVRSPYDLATLRVERLECDDHFSELLAKVRSDLNDRVFMIYRRGLVVHLRDLQPMHARIIEAIQKVQSLNDAVASIGEDGIAEEDIVQVFQILGECGLISPPCN